MVKLTNHAPNIVEAILDDALPNGVTLFNIAVDPPELREEQRRTLFPPPPNRPPVPIAH